MGPFSPNNPLHLDVIGLIVSVLGFIILFVAEILQIVSFFSLSDQTPQPSPISGQQQVQ